MGSCTTKPRGVKNTQSDNCSGPDLNVTQPTKANKKPPVRKMSDQTCYFYDGYLRKIVRVPVLLPLENSSLY